MSSESAFTIAVVTSFDPVAVSLQEFELGPGQAADDLFNEASAPKGRDYPFDLIEADYLIDDAGQERTTGWQWTGQSWGAVVQRRTDPAGDPRYHPEKLPPLKAWEQGGYDE